MFASAKFTPTPRKLRREKTTLSTNSDTDKDPVHVYCRLKPLKDFEETKTCMKLLSPQEITLTCESKCFKKEICYKFKHIFTSYSNQKEIFDKVAFPLLEDLLNGKNALLFTYGVTGSGKTYTLTGDQNNPGIMPRCIDTIFNSITEFQAPKYVIKPDKMNGFEIQSEDDAIQDRQAEMKCFGKTPKGMRKPSDKINYTNDGKKIAFINEKNVYAVFVTYVEIYNNNVYDLLDDSVSMRGTFQNKILREDSQRNMYVNGVVEMEVKSAQEAFEAFNVGQKRKRTAFTNLNAESSRSHSIFNIRVVQLEQETCNSDGKFVVPEGNLLKVGQLSLVDLAGSERTNRTQNTGARLKEASCINNSLMSLRTCMETLRENQRFKSNKVVPYRDSRLTYLFKNYFEGDGSVQMIVCINPSMTDLEENLHVLKFAELSQDVKVTRSEPKFTPVTAKKTVSKRIATPAKVKGATNLFSVIPEMPIVHFDINNIEEFGISLEKVLKALRTSKRKSIDSNMEVKKQAGSFRKRLVRIDKDQILKLNELQNMKNINKNHLKKENNYEVKIQNLERINENLMMKNEELQEAIRSLHNTVDEKDLKLNQNMLEREKQRQKIALASEKMSKELDDKLRKQREHLNAAMMAKEIQLQKVKEALLTEVVVDPRNDEIENIPPQIPKTPSSENHRRQMISTTPRNRRSRSADGVWLEHNSVKPVPLGTVFQPTMKKRKSLTKLTKATDITNPKQTKYCLVAQEKDNEGEMETKLYKADILPTCGGGAQVIFNDVEHLTQKSPTASPSK